MPEAARTGRWITASARAAAALLKVLAMAAAYYPVLIVL